MNALTPLAVRIGSLSWLPRFLPQITATDRLLQRVTRGRVTILDIAGLPNLMLTVTGRKSGLERTTPLLCVPHEGSYLIAGSYFGGPKTPAWVANLRAADRVRIRVGGRWLQATPREVADGERARLWEVMVATWPNYRKYEERTDRTIPVFVLAVD